MSLWSQAGRGLQPGPRNLLSYEVGRPLRATLQACCQVQTGDFPGGAVVETVLPLQEAQVRSLVGELRSHMLHGTDKKKRAGVEHKVQTE